MRYRALIPLALIGAALVPAGAQAETRYLDAYDRGRDRYAGPLRMAERLERGRPYVAEVRGTASFFIPRLYTDNCGSRPESRPLFRSLRRPNGAVGFDSEFVFAEPRVARQCAQPNPPFRTDVFQLSTGLAYRHVAPLGRTLTAPRRSHRYAYPLVGRGRPAKFRVVDGNTRDNYGRFRITVRRARAADCAGTGYPAFGFVTEADCVVATGRR